MGITYIKFARLVLFSISSSFLNQKNDFINRRERERERERESLKKKKKVILRVEVC